MATIALVDGDEQSRLRLERFLRADGLDVLTGADGLEGLRIAFDARPDAALIDLDSGEFGGTELIRILRAACDVPIVALLADHSSDAVVRALDAGADDVIPKSTGSAELRARLRAAVRRYERADATDGGSRQLIRTGGIEIDRDARLVRLLGAPVQLSRTEYRLLEALGSRLGETAPHRYLLSTVWGDDYVDDTHYLRVYVGYLRAKFEKQPSQPQYILNDWGVGYRLARLPIVESGGTREPIALGAAE